MVDPKKLLLLLKGYEKFKVLTKAIQMVALSQLSSLKLKMASRQYALGAVVPYFNPELYSDKTTRNALIAITVDKSCCGPHNNNILKAATSLIESLKEKNKLIKIISIGQKAKFYFKKYYRSFQCLNFYNVDREPLSLFTSMLMMRKIVRVTSYDTLFIVFNRFYTAFTQKVSYYELCSFGYFKYHAMLNSYSSDKKSHLATALFNSMEECKSDNFYLELYCYSISLFILDALEENEYSALGARATAMNNATKNAGELIDKLRLLYNKARQEKITNELIEIVSCVNFVN